MSITETLKTNPRSILKSLVETLLDGQKGFQQSAESVKNPTLKELFFNLSLQRAQFAGTLKSELLALGEKDPEKETGSVAGTVHRGWIDLKSAILKQDDHAVLAEAERGEDVAVKAFKDALENDLPAPLREIISEQAVEVKAGHDQVKALRDASKKA